MTALFPESRKYGQSKKLCILQRLFVRLLLGELNLRQLPWETRRASCLDVVGHVVSYGLTQCVRSRKTR